MSSKIQVPPEVVAKKTSVDDILPLTPDSKKRWQTRLTDTAKKKQKEKQLPGVKNICKTTKKSLICCQNKRKKEINKSAAFKKCTTWYAKEKKNQQGLSATRVVDSVNYEFGTNINVRTVQHYVQNNCVGMSRQKTGPTPGLMPKEYFATLLDAFHLFVQINQINCETHKNLLTKLNPCVHKTVRLKSHSKSRRLVNQLRSCGVVDLSVQCIPTCKER